MASRAVIALVAAAALSGNPTAVFGQSLNLGQAADYMVLQAPNSSSYNFTTMANSSVSDNVALAGNPTLYALSMTNIGGSLSFQESASSVNATGSMSNFTAQAGIQAGVNLSQATQDAVNAANVAASLSAPLSNTYGNITTSTTFSGNAAQNVFSVSSIYLSGGQITISGSGAFVINVTGNTAGDSIYLYNSSVLASPGVTSVIFNIENGGNVSVGGSSETHFQASILDMSQGSVSLSSTYMEGQLITNGGISLSSTSIVTPELPTLAVAGLAGLVALGTLSFRRLRSRKLARSLGAS